MSPRNPVRLVALIRESMLRRRGVTGRAGSPISPALTRFQLAARGLGASKAGRLSHISSGFDPWSSKKELISTFNHAGLANDSRQFVGPYVSQGRLRSGRSAKALRMAKSYHEQERQARRTFPVLS